MNALTTPAPAALSARGRIARAPSAPRGTPSGCRAMCAPIRASYRRDNVVESVFEYTQLSLDTSLGLSLIHISEPTRPY